MRNKELHGRRSNVEKEIKFYMTKGKGMNIEYKTGENMQKEPSTVLFDVE